MKKSFIVITGVFVFILLAFLTAILISENDKSVIKKYIKERKSADDKNRLERHAGLMKRVDL